MSKHSPVGGRRIRLVSMAEYDWTDWTDWEGLTELDLQSLSTGPGAYVLSTGSPLHRAVGTDEQGILDIGESAGLRGRIQSFLSCAQNYGNEGHMAGWRYSFFRFSRHFALEDLRIRWVGVESKKIAREIEGRVMVAYLANHAELPPLNYSFNWSPFPGGAIQISFNYTETLAPEEDRKATSMRPNITWVVSRHISLTMNYNISQSDSELQEAESSSLNTRLRLIF